MVSMIKCCVCKKTYKNTCVDITTAELRTLNSNKGYDWSCKNCRTVASDIKDLKSLLIKLQEEIQSLKSTNVDVRPVNEVFFEEVVTEVADRAKRQSNLIVFGLEEPDQNLTSAERFTIDKNEVADIIHIIKPNVITSDIKPIRLGKYSPQKKRPIKIKLNSEQEVVDIIRNAKKISNSRYHKKISISFDRTPKQQDLYRKIKYELQERLGSGETNLIIRYRNNVPVIVPKN